VTEPFDPAAMADNLLASMQAMATLLDTCAGYRELCIERGFSPSAAEVMAMAYHAALMAGLHSAWTSAQ
jgi:hypothetical protein